MAIRLLNNWVTILAAAVGIGDTTISVVDASTLPDLSAAEDYSLLTLIGNGVVEIVRVNGVSGNDLSVVRAQDDTTAQAFAVGDRIEMRNCAGVFKALQNEARPSKTAVASENLASGDFVTLFDSAGASTARKASAAITSGGGRAHGYVLSNVIATETAVVYLSGINTGLSGLTVGGRYFNSDTTPGEVVAARPILVGQLCQLLGIATSSTEISFVYNDGTIL